MARARAASDAALLTTPQLQLQGLRLPTGGALDDTTLGRAGIQLRAGLSWSPVDLYRGVRTLQLGAARCATIAAERRAETALRVAPDRGLLAARRREAAFLDNARATWEAHVATTEERMRAGVVTFAQVQEVRGRALALERLRVQVDTEIAVLDARGKGASTDGPLTAARDAERARAAEEDQTSRLRALDSWKLGVTGGVVPRDGPADYYGMVLVGVSTGVFFRNAYERDAARAADGSRDSGEPLHVAAARIEEERRLRAEGARREVAVLDRELQRLAAARAALETSGASAAPHAIALTDLERIALEAERTFSAALVLELAPTQPDGATR